MAAVDISMSHGASGNVCKYGLQFTLGMSRTRWLGRTWKMPAVDICGIDYVNSGHFAFWGQAILHEAPRVNSRPYVWT